MMMRVRFGGYACVCGVFWWGVDMYVCVCVYMHSHFEGHVHSAASLE